jgi:hypothetical protein
MENPKTKTWFHPDHLRTVNFGGYEEGYRRWVARIKRETEAVEELQKQGFTNAWAIVKQSRGWIN